MLGTAKGPAVSWHGLEGQVPQGADSGVGAEGVWLEGQNSCVFLHQCAQSSSSIHPVAGRGESLFGASLQLVGHSVSSEGALRNPQHHLAELPAWGKLAVLAQASPL